MVLVPGLSLMGKRESIADRCGAKSVIVKTSLQAAVRRHTNTSRFTALNVHSPPD
jgi:hypothetical protein